MIGRLSQNSLTMIFLGSILCVFCLYIQGTLLNVVSHYYLSVLSMSVMGSLKKFG